MVRRPTERASSSAPPARSCTPARVTISARLLAPLRKHFATRSTPAAPHADPVRTPAAHAVSGLPPPARTPSVNTTAAHVPSAHAVAGHTTARRTLRVALTAAILALLSAAADVATAASAPGAAILLRGSGA